MYKLVAYFLIVCISAIIKIQTCTTNSFYFPHPVNSYVNIIIRVIRAVNCPKHSDQVRLASILLLF
jgi:hypothetical protein